MTEKKAFETVNENANSGVIILCDHASRFVPADISDDDLGLGLSDLERHIAYDVGALEVAQLISQQLNATMVFSCFSRLLIDANRGETDPTLVMRLYDRTVIPGNRHVPDTEIARRIARFHRPYRAEIARIIDAKIAKAKRPVLVSIHSFTPQLRGHAARPWHIGILYQGTNHFAQALIRDFSVLPGVCVGDNQPYSGQLPGCTMDEHGSKRGLAHALIEYRNDLIQDAVGQTLWAEKTLPALKSALQQEKAIG